MKLVSPGKEFTVYWLGGGVEQRSHEDQTTAGYLIDNSLQAEGEYGEEAPAQRYNMAMDC